MQVPEGLKLGVLLQDPPCKSNFVNPSVEDIEEGSVLKQINVQHFQKTHRWLYIHTGGVSRDRKKHVGEFSCCF